LEIPAKNPFAVYQYQSTVLSPTEKRGGICCEENGTVVDLSYFPSLFLFFLEQTVIYTTKLKQISH
jgi:hypothetical protein